MEKYRRDPDRSGFFDGIEAAGDRSVLQQPDLSLCFPRAFLRRPRASSRRPRTFRHWLPRPAISQEICLSPWPRQLWNHGIYSNIFSRRWPRLIALLSTRREVAISDVVFSMGDVYVGIFAEISIFVGSSEMVAFEISVPLRLDNAMEQSVLYTAG